MHRGVNTVTSASDQTCDPCISAGLNEPAGAEVRELRLTRGREFIHLDERSAGVSPLPRTTAVQRPGEASGELLTRGC